MHEHSYSCTDTRFLICLISCLPEHLYSCTDTVTHISSHMPYLVSRVMCCCRRAPPPADQQPSQTALPSADSQAPPPVHTDRPEATQPGQPSNSAPTDDNNTQPTNATSPTSFFDYFNPSKWSSSTPVSSPPNPAASSSSQPTSTSKQPQQHQQQSQQQYSQQQQLQSQQQQQKQLTNQSPLPPRAPHPNHLQLHNMSTARSVCRVLCCCIDCSCCLHTYKIAMRAITDTLSFPFCMQSSSSDGCEQQHTVTPIQSIVQHQNASPTHSHCQQLPSKRISSSSTACCIFAKFSHSQFCC